jgi:predicted patatin/cPLA2 family phospholipase
MGALPVFRKILTFAFASLLAGCATLSRLPAPPTGSTLVTPADYQTNLRINSYDPQAGRVVTALYNKAIAASDGTIDIMALSGGGAGGAFGVGVLMGMGHSGTRPQFEIVTGVSSGALIAPYAFLGPSWDQAITEIYTAPQTANLVVRRGFGALFQASLYRTDHFIQWIESHVTPQFMDAIARESRTGRLLLVATTNIDTGASIIWNMGLIAEQGGPRARQLFIDVLIASSSIPAVFPPKLIDVESGGQHFQEMHVDGGVAVPFFVVPANMSLEDDTIRRLKGANLYVILNGPIGIGPANGALKTTSIIPRSFEIDQVYRARQNIALTAYFATRNEMVLCLTWIPPSYPYQGSLVMDQPAMKSLFKAGFGLARSGEAWKNADELAAELGRRDVSARP